MPQKPAGRPERGRRRGSATVEQEIDDHSWAGVKAGRRDGMRPAGYVASCPYVPSGLLRGIGSRRRVSGSCGTAAPGS
jgi:hypothetical protein